MNYRDLVRMVAQKESTSYQQAESIANSLIDVIVDQVKQGKSVRLKRFATIKPLVVPERDRYIPGSKEVKRFPASVSVKIVPSKQLKETLQPSG